MSGILKTLTLPDYAACTTGNNNRPLDKVGINNVEIYRADCNDHPVLTTQSAYVSLGHESGAHMSRLIGSLMNHENDAIDIDNELLNEIQETHDMASAYWNCRWRGQHTDEVSFFYDANLEGITRSDKDNSWYITVVVPYASVCPCSHEMVKHVGHGVPHMQRCEAKVTGLIGNDDFDWILPTMISNIADAVKLIPERMMKRPDELDWCKRAAETNLFVEDSARNIATAIDEMFDDWVVVAEHQESIHQHNVTAVCKKGQELL